MAPSVTDYRDTVNIDPGADPGFEKGGFNVVLKSDTGGATHNYL